MGLRFERKVGENEKLGTKARRDKGQVAMNNEQ